MIDLSPEAIAQLATRLYNEQQKASPASTVSGVAPAEPALPAAPPNPATHGLPIHDGWGGVHPARCGRDTRTYNSLTVSTSETYHP